MYSNLVRSKNPKTHLTYRTIARRLKACNIDLDCFIKKDLKVYENTLDGISFLARKRANPLIPFDILTALRSATKTHGLPAFREGEGEDAKHWALDLSMAQTTGIGFREIWRPVLSTHGQRLNWAKSGAGLNKLSLDDDFSAHFGDSSKRLDLSSLHCAIHGDFCSIHIDETGFVMDGLQGLSDDVMLTPDFLRHLLVELLWKDKLKVPPQIDLVIPGSANNYSRVGLSATFFKTDNLKLSVTGTCSVRGKFGCSGTLNLTGRHDWLGGGSK